MNEPQQSDTNALSELIRKVTKGRETAFDVIETAAGKTLTISQRQLQPEVREPERCESPPRKHVLMTAAAVVDYLQKYGGEHTVVLLDATAMVGRIVLDETAPTGFEVLTFGPTLHPLFVEWQQIIGRRLEVTAFAEFLLNNRRQVVDPDGKTAAHIFSQVRADKATTIHRGQGKNSINGVVVQLKIGTGVQDVPIDLPESLTIRVPLFVGEPAQDIVLDLLIGEVNDQVWVLTSAASIKEAMHAAFAEMENTIRESVVPAHVAVVAAGVVDHGQWVYLK